MTSGVEHDPGVSNAAANRREFRRDPAGGAAARFGWITHSGMDVSQFVSMHILGAVFPLSAGLLLYGWRALMLILLLSISTGLSLLLWRRVGRRGRTLRFDHAMWLALLLALSLPAHLFSETDRSGFTTTAPWPVIPAAGVALAILLWALGTYGSGRVHAVLVVQLLLVVLFKDLLVPHYTLQRMSLFRGDVLDAAVARKPEARRGDAGGGQDIKLPWLRLPNDIEHDALYTEPVSQRLVFYTSGTESPERAWISLEGLIRDRMPPLEDLIIGGQPGPIGSSSAIAVIIGGLFLLYRGLIDYRIPLMIFLSAYLSMLLLPIPILITEQHETWQWMIARPPPAGVGWQVALTFVHYELLASPLLFMAFFLATAPAVRPMSRRGRAAFAILVGVFAAVFQLYLAVSIGPYLALLGVSLLTPLIDRLFRPRTLV